MYYFYQMMNDFLYNGWLCVVEFHMVTPESTE